jgi:hypothetical protein
MVSGLAPVTFGMRSIENLTSSAVKSEPSWNLTPLRRLNSQVVSSIAFQLSARRGSISSPSPDQVKVSKTCFSASAWVPVAVKCGSMDSGPARTPMFSVCASDGIAATDKAPRTIAAFSPSLCVFMFVTPCFVPWAS